jgi:hypothetical protein
MCCNLVSLAFAKCITIFAYNNYSKLPDLPCFTTVLPPTSSCSRLHHRIDFIHRAASFTMSTPFDIMALIYPKPGKADRVQLCPALPIWAFFDTTIGNRAPHDYRSSRKIRRTRHVAIPSASRNKGRRADYCHARDVRTSPLYPCLCPIFC